MNTRDDENQPWIEAVEGELRRYRDQFEDDEVTLDELYEFSEQRLSQQFPENQHVRAKIRQTLQSLRDEGKVVFLDNRGTYKIMINGGATGLPALSTEIFELLDGSREEKREANKRFKEVTAALEEVLDVQPKFEEFVWPGVGRKNSSPYTSRPHRQPGPNREAEYRSHCWLGVAHRSYRDRYERPQDGLQFQFTVRSDSEQSRPPAEISLHLDEAAERALRDEIRSNLRTHQDTFLSQIRALDGFEIALGTESWSPDRIEAEWDEFIQGLDNHFRVYYPLSEDEIEGLDTRLVPEIVSKFDDLLPVYSLVSGIKISEPASEPQIWIEKTATQGRPYKQESEYALGKALMSPSRDEAGRKRYETMREPEVGDIVLHFLQDRSVIGGVSIIDSELIEDFHDPPHDRWTDEQQQQGGYLRWLRDYTPLDPPIHIYDDVLQNPVHEQWLHDIRESYSNIVFTKNLSLNQGHYFTRCPEELAQVLVTESSALKRLLNERGYEVEPIDPPEDGYWHMVFTKRKKATEFIENPSENVFSHLVDANHFWGSMAYRNWPNELFEHHTPADVAGAIQRSRESGDLTHLLDLYQMGVSKATEILRALDPDRYAILNKRSKEGMSTLGYELPSEPPTVDEYRTFTEQVRKAHDEFGLRGLMEREKEERIPARATKLEVADWAFSDHFEGRIDLASVKRAGAGETPEPEPAPEQYTDYAEELSVSFDNIELDPGGLHFENWERIEERIVQALREGSHILLFGPPGTGKTKLAREICETVVGLGQFEMVTGSADWSTFDTIGGYQSTREQELRFEPGVILERFHADKTGTPANEWLVIDELNRADIDKAFGALFSALTGESVTLPFKHTNGKNIEIVDPSRSDDIVRPHRYFMPNDWRMISTMNTLDKTSLYEMSYAFMRRWAFIPVGIPDIPDPDVAGGRDRLSRMVEQYVLVWDSEHTLTDDQLATIGEIWYTVNQQRSIGPAIVEDIYRYVASSGADGEPDYVSPIVMYVFPQLEGLRRGKLKTVIDGLEEIVDEPSDLRDTAEDFFQADLSEATGE